MTRTGWSAQVRRWVATALVAVLVAAGCVAAGIWQWNRHADRTATVAVIEANYDGEPVPLADVVPTPSTTVGFEQTWRVVSVTGHYLPESSVLLRNRPVGGQPGFHVLEPFMIDEGALAGSVLVVDRGWVPTAPDWSTPETVPQVPTGTTELVARLRADEPRSDRQAPAGQVHAIHTAQVRSAHAVGSSSEQWPADATLPFYGQVVREDGVAPADLGALPRPDTSTGSNLSYAFQWWVFAVGALGGCVVLILRDRDDAVAGPAEDVEGVAHGAGGPVDRSGRNRRRRRPTAEEEEDALVDAQQR